MAKTYAAVIPAGEISRLLEYAHVFASFLLEDAHADAIDAEETKQVSASKPILALISRLLQFEKYVSTEVVGSLDDLSVSFKHAQKGSLSC